MRPGRRTEENHSRSLPCQPPYGSRHERTAIEWLNRDEVTDNPTLGDVQVISNGCVVQPPRSLLPTTRPRLQVRQWLWTAPTQCRHCRTAQATNASNAIPAVRDQPTQERAHSLVQSQSKFVTSLSSDGWCQLGHGGAPEQLSVRARPDCVKRTAGNAPSRLLRRGDDIPALVEIETAVTSMTWLERATPARHPASISLPLVSFSQIDSSRHVPTICSLILRACSSTRAASSIAPVGAHGCEREAQKHRDRKCSEQVAREGPVLQDQSSPSCADIQALGHYL